MLASTTVWMKSGAGRIGAVEVEALEQRELLQDDRALRPRARLAHRVAAVVVGERRLDGGLPLGHVLAAQQAFVALARDVQQLFVGVEAVDRLGDEALAPRLARALDLGLAAAAAGLGFLDDAQVGVADGRGCGTARRASAPCCPAGRPRPRSASCRGNCPSRWRWWPRRARPSDGRSASSRWRAPARRPAASCRSRAASACRRRRCRARRPAAGRCRGSGRGPGP